MDAYLPLTSNLSPRDTFIPYRDHLASAQGELQSSAAYRAVKIFAVREPACVVDLYGLTFVCGCASSNLDVPILQPGGSLSSGSCDLSWSTRGGSGRLLRGCALFRGIALGEHNRCRQNNHH